MSLIENIVLSPNERFLHLSSEYASEKLNGTAECKFRVAYPVSASNEQYCMAVGVHNASIPHTYYNVFGRNFRMYFSNVAGNIIQGSIAKKNYTATSFALELQTTINALLVAAGASGTFTVTYNSETNFLTYFYPVVAAQSPWYFMAVQDDCYLEQGMSNLRFGNTSAVVSSLNNAGTAFVLTPPFMLDLSAFHGVYVNLLSTSGNAQASYASLAMTNILARIPIRNPFGAIETYEPENITYLYIPNGVLTDIHIRLTGDDGNILDLNGSEWTMTLHVKYFAISNPLLSKEGILTGVSMQGVQAMGGRRFS
jgi:hypothetical protein